jgi:hypothetical protein
MVCVCVCVCALFICSVCMYWYAISDERAAQALLYLMVEAAAAGA